MYGKCVRLQAGRYRYKNYILIKHGYYPPDKCIWWEAINNKTNEADFHAHTKRHLIQLIDDSET